MSNLPFENQLLLDTFSEDVLFIFAQGLSVEQMFVNHLKLYSDPKVLVLVINTSGSDEQFFAEQLENDERLEVGPRFITSEISVNDRKALYLTGGVQFVTSRILVVDLLMDRVPAHLISGIMVYKAHQVLNSFQESFILRLYRQKKKDGFVKAFSDVPSAIGDAGGNIGQLQRLVRSLYVRKVQLIPRFEADVKLQLQERAPEIVEMAVELSPPMKRIQTSLLEIIAACVRELKQRNTGLINEDELAEEEDDALGTKAALSLTSFYDSPVEKKLSSEECFDQLSDKSKRLLDDLKFLRLLLKQMEQLDPATFWNTLAAFKSDEKEFHRNSGWLFTSAAATLFSEAKLRIRKSGTNPLEVPPKWDALKFVLKDVREAYSAFKTEPSAQHVTGSVLLLVDNSVCGRQLCELLKKGPGCLLANLSESIIGCDIEKVSPETSITESWWDENQMTLESFHSKLTTSNDGEWSSTAIERWKKSQIADIRRDKGDGGQTSLEDYEYLSPTKRPKRSLEEEGSEKASGSEEVTIEEFPLLLIHSLDSSRYQLHRVLKTMDPTFVILYHSNLASIRILEMFKSRRESGNPLRIYSILYKDSAEEQRYLGSISRENRAFNFLIQEKGSLLIPREYDTSRDSGVLRPEKSTRRAGGQQMNVVNEEDRSMVVIDMREFRSELPLLLYRRGMDIAPVTLEVGDYILTPELCVERKSLSDLAGSLLKGRLYSQVEKMLRHYKNVIVLIEGDGVKNSGRKKAWFNRGAFSGEMGPKNRTLRQKLALLTRKFPELSLVWTPGPKSSVDIFEELKWEKAEPDPDTAVSIRWDEKSKSSSSSSQPQESVSLRKYNPVQRAMLLALPGVTEKNVVRILDQGISFSHLFMSNGLEALDLPSETKNSWSEVWKQKIGP